MSKLNKKPIKKNDSELFKLLERKISGGDYVFKSHAKRRLIDRSINDLEVLDILQGIKSRGRRRNKAKDKYVEGYSDWNYCIEGKNLDNKKIRIIISFEDNLVPIITVMWL